MSSVGQPGKVVCGKVEESPSIWQATHVHLQPLSYMLLRPHMLVAHLPASAIESQHFAVNFHLTVPPGPGRRQAHPHVPLSLHTLPVTLPSCCIQQQPKAIAGYCCQCVFEWTNSASRMCGSGIHCASWEELLSADSTIHCGQPVAKTAWRGFRRG